LEILTDMAIGNERVVTAKLPADLVARLDDVAQSMERSKSWIIRQALHEWLAEEERRHELTMEGLRDIDEGRVVSHEDILAMVALKKAQARAKD
jgi:predicted transcriptional regulator